MFQLEENKEGRERKLDIKIEDKEVNVTVKKHETGDIGTLLDRFSEGVTRFKVHFFDIETQLKHFRYLKENMKENKALIHVDLSENYECKLAREIQSMHQKSKSPFTLVCAAHKFIRNILWCLTPISMDHATSCLGISWANSKQSYAGAQRNRYLTF